MSNKIFDYNNLTGTEKEKFCLKYNINTNEDLEKVLNKKLRRRS